MLFLFIVTLIFFLNYYFCNFCKRRFLLFHLSSSDNNSLKKTISKKNLLFLKDFDLYALKIVYNSSNFSISPRSEALRLYLSYKVLSNFDALRLLTLLKKEEDLINFAILGLAAQDQINNKAFFVKKLYQFLLEKDSSFNPLLLKKSKINS